MIATSSASSRNIRHWQMSTGSGAGEVLYRRTSRRRTCGSRQRKTGNSAGRLLMHARPASVLSATAFPCHLGDAWQVLLFQLLQVLCVNSKCAALSI
jgi:hypothetical protein